MPVSFRRFRLFPVSIGQALLWALLPTLLFVLHAPDATYAQVVTNITSTTGAGNLGTTVTQAGNVYDITGGTRPGNGPNLFHSFGEFSVPTNNIANFLNETALPTSNILSRVTGGNPSNIFGTLQTTNFGAANLYLINPAGVIFGPNAQLNVGGSFAASTADYLKMADGATFYAIPVQSTVLSVAPVAAFGFLSSQPAPIVVQGSMLQVPEGQSLSLVGGDITVQAGTLGDDTIQAASLRAPGGQLNLVSVASPGEVLVPSVQTGSFTTMGTVMLMEGATLDVSGNPIGNGNSGTVFVRGGQLVMDASTIMANTVGAVDGASTAVDLQLSQDVAFSNGAAIITTTSGPGRGGDVQLIASIVQMDNNSLFATESFGDGRGGNITANVGTFSLTNGAAIISHNSSLGIGQGGDVIVQGLQGPGSAADAVALTNGSAIFTQTEGPGSGGDVQLTAHTLTMENFPQIQTVALGGGGVGGDVVLNVGTGSLLGGASILSQTLNSTPEGGQGGNVIIQGLQGAGSMADSVVLSGFGSGIVSQTAGTARAGDIAVLAKTVSLLDASTILTQTSGPGRGGDVHLTADNLTLENASRISTDTFIGDAVGGDLFLNVGTVRLLAGPLGGSQLQSTNFNSGTDLDFDGLVDVTGVGGNVTVQGTQGAGSAADSVVLSGGSQIVSTTSGSGKGGTITIQAGEVLLDRPGTGISFDTPQPFADMTLTINILHPNAGDLVVELESPTGTHVTLLKGVGEDGNNFSNTQFNDHASTQISSGSAPFTGPFKPLEQLGQFIDQPSAGKWTLTVRDQAGENVGLLESWTLRIAGQTFQSTGGPVAIPDEGSVRSTIAVATPAGSTVPGPGDPAGISGDVTINAGTVTVQNGATLSATTRGTGKGGTIIINATGPVALTGSGSGLFSESEASGAGGNITVQASGMTMDSGASVSAASSGTGDSGTITINAGSEFLSTNSSVTTEATQASGGNITLVTSDMIRLQNSQISASVSGETQTAGGNITIDPQFVILQNSQIIARANAGSGGTINITAGVFVTDPASIVDASATSGNSGTVSIQSPVQNLGGQLTPLPQQFTSAADLLLASRCAADPTGQFSSFVQTGREGVPQIPGALSPSPLSFLETLTSGSWGSSSPNWAAGRLGLDSVRFDDATRFYSACRS